MTRYAMSNGGTVPFSDITVQLSLLANTGLTYTVPGPNSISYRAEFSWNDDESVWVGYNITPTVPSSGTITQTNSVERNPKIKFVRGGDVLTFISRDITADSGFSLLQLAS